MTGHDDDVFIPTIPDQAVSLVELRGGEFGYLPEHRAAKKMTVPVHHLLEAVEIKKGDGELVSGRNQSAKAMMQKTSVPESTHIVGD